MTDKERIEKAAEEYGNNHSEKGERYYEPIVDAYIAGATAEQPIIEDLKQQLAAVTQERDRLKAAHEMYREESIRNCWRLLRGLTSMTRQPSSMRPSPKTKNFSPPTTH